MLDLIIPAFCTFTFLFLFAVGGTVIFGLARFIWRYRCFPDILVFISDPESDDFRALTDPDYKHHSESKTGC